MKTSELKKIVEDNGYKTTSYLEWIDISKDGIKLCYVSTRTIRLFNVFDSLQDKVIAQAILEYAYTPLEEREEEKKYYLMFPKGFTSTKMYLKENNGLYDRTYDIKAYNEYESKTQFTQKEINAMPFDTKFFEKVEAE